jgi:D-alanyl-D-alanine dipeptidase
MKLVDTNFIKIIIIYLILFIGCVCLAGEPEYSSNEQIQKEEKFDLSLKQEDIVDVKKVAPKVHIKAVYFSNQNFVGEKVNGYVAKKCFLQKEAADAVKLVSEDIAEFGYVLIVLDCYRPLMAVDQFVEWANNSSDSKTKSQYYPNVKKQDLIAQGYIAEKSQHSSGHTIDVTIGRPSGLSMPFELNMGTSHDFFDDRSNTFSKKNSREAIKKRMLLKMTLEKYGFLNYSKEWWHFSYKDNAYKDVRFNFDVK